MARRAALKKGVTFLVVRHPFERLLSAYEVFLLRVPFNEFLHCCIKVVFVGIWSLLWARTNCPNWRHGQNPAQLQNTLIGVSTPLEPSSKEFFTGFRRQWMHQEIAYILFYPQIQTETRPQKSSKLLRVLPFSGRHFSCSIQTSKMILTESLKSPWNVKIWHAHLAPNSQVTI